MQLVKEKYYYALRNVTAGISLLIVLSVIGSYYFEILEVVRLNYGLNITAGVFAGLHVIYSLALFHVTAKRGIWYASIVCSMLFSMTVLNIIHSTGDIDSGLFYTWAFMTLVSGIFGQFAIIGSLFTITFYFMIASSDKLNFATLTLQDVLPLLTSFIAAAISWIVFKHLYTDSDSDRVQQLSGMLRNKQQQTDILIQAISDAIIVINNDGKISLMNPAAAKMTEWSIEEAIGIETSTVLKLSSEDGKPLPDTENPVLRSLKNKEQISETYQLTGREGKTQIVSCAISPLNDPSQQIQSGAVAVIRDVSTARAEEKRRADFISTASHEMRTPVAAIEGYLSLVLNGNVSKIDDKARQYVEKARSSTQHLGKLFQDLLTSAKAEDGRLVNHPVVIEMGEFLEQLTDSFAFSAEKKGLLMDFKVGSSSAMAGAKVVAPLYYVHADPDRLREVVTNIFDNAVKYTETGKISLGLTGNNDVVQFFIEDTGPGIPEEDVGHLFQKFYRVDNTTTRTIGGTGLGLFICRKIVELYKGRIWVESQIGQGSTFYINLPRISSQKAAQLQTQETPETLNKGLPGA